MADNYVQFSEVIECPSADAAKWLEDELFDVCSTDRGRDKRHLYLFSDENVDLELLADGLSRYQVKYLDISEYIKVQWAETCSKPRVGEFGGGAFICHNGLVNWMTTSEWVENFDPK